MDFLKVQIARFWISLLWMTIFIGSKKFTGILFQNSFQNYINLSFNIENWKLWIEKSCHKSYPKNFASFWKSSTTASSEEDVHSEATGVNKTATKNACTESLWEEIWCILSLEISDSIQKYTKRMISICLHFVYTHS